MGGRVADVEGAFTVAVVATVSAGKSTLINALLGDDVLPTDDSTCTATVFRVEDHDGLHGIWIRNGAGRWERVNANRLPDCNVVDKGEVFLKGDVVGVRNLESLRLVLLDTPGTNGARALEEARMTRSLLRKGAYDLIVVVLDLVGWGTTDEADVIAAIPESRRGDVIFVANKFDALCSSGDGGLSGTICRVRSHLRDLGFAGGVPLVPVSARLALLQRKGAASRLTADEVLEKRYLSCIMSQRIGVLREEAERLDATFGGLFAGPVAEKMLSGVPVLECLFEARMRASAKGAVRSERKELRSPWTS